MRATVFFVSVHSDCTEKEAEEAISTLYQALDIEGRLDKEKFALLKIHFGEDGTDRFIKPKFVRALVSLIKAKSAKVVLGDTNTLYPGRRCNAAEHLMLAHEHGFTPEKVGCAVMILDGLVGRAAMRVKVNGDHFEEVELAHELQFFDHLFVLTHVTGHIAAGLGGSIKNMGMGLATRSGKLAQHNAQPLKVDAEKCTACGVCARWCPQGAITVEKVAAIDAGKCVSCGWCVAVCKRHAIKFSWEISHRVLQERIAEYAAGAYMMLQPNVFCFNFLHRIHANCDCMKDGGEKLCEDIGIVAGQNPAAVDSASLALINEAAGRDILAEMRPKIDHRVQMHHFAKVCGLTTEYEIVRL